MKFVYCVAFVLGCHILAVRGHGMMLEPVARGSRWRFDSSAPVNYNDNELFCGGFNTQWNTNGGRCGLCGDDYRSPTPRAHENGGTYGNGVIVRTYRSGDTIPVSVLITANHWGHFLFDLCDLRNGRESENCFAANKLKLANGSDRLRIPNHVTGQFNTTLRLPPNLECTQCVLRWTYITANSWGTCGDGSGAIGCGPQENFRTCSDVRIVRSRKVANEKNSIDDGESKLLEKLRPAKLTDSLLG